MFLYKEKEERMQDKMTVKKKVWEAIAVELQKDGFPVVYFVLYTTRNAWQRLAYSSLVI